MSTRPGAQNAKTILGIVKCYTLDESRQDFFGGSFWLRAHTTAMITAITAPPGAANKVTTAINRPVSPASEMTVRR
jgi:hypothetical protein